VPARPRRRAILALLAAIAEALVAVVAPTEAADLGREPARHRAAAVNSPRLVDLAALIASPSGIRVTRHPRRSATTLAVLRPADRHTLAPSDGRARRIAAASSIATQSHPVAMESSMPVLSPAVADQRIRPERSGGPQGTSRSRAA
jgi:hypothetical protein